MCNFYSNIKTIQQFLNATCANWRNSIYIECCNCRVNCDHSRDFLYAPGPDGAPVIVPVCDMEFLFSRSLDKTECMAEFTVTRFKSFYAEWLQSNLQDSEGCQLMQVVKAMNAPKDW